VTSHSTIDSLESLALRLLALAATHRAYGTVPDKVRAAAYTDAARMVRVLAEELGGES